MKRRPNRGVRGHYPPRATPRASLAPSHKTTQPSRPRTTSTAACAARHPRNAAFEISEASVFFDRRLSDRDMCDPPTRPRPRSLLFGGRYSAEANAARAERWRTLAVLQTRGVETAGWKAQASAATDAACDAREAREIELGTHEANATRSSQVVVSTATPELESEEKTRQIEKLKQELVALQDDNRRVLSKAFSNDDASDLARVKQEMAIRDAEVKKLKDQIKKERELHNMKMLKIIQLLFFLVGLVTIILT